ncbi:MAG: hypothetical protein R2883_03880 [Caldisericia bacterium]
MGAPIFPSTKALDMMFGVEPPKTTKHAQEKPHIVHIRFTLMFLISMLAAPDFVLE